MARFIDPNVPQGRLAAMHDLHHFIQAMSTYVLAYGSVSYSLANQPLTLKVGP